MSTGAYIAISVRLSTVTWVEAMVGSPLRSETFTLKARNSLIKEALTALSSCRHSANLTAGISMGRHDGGIGRFFLT